MSERTDEQVPTKQPSRQAKGSLPEPQAEPTSRIWIWTVYFWVGSFVALGAIELFLFVRGFF